MVVLAPELVRRPDLHSTYGPTADTGGLMQNGPCNTPRGRGRRRGQGAVARSGRQAVHRAAGVIGTGPVGVGAGVAPSPAEAYRI
jgi:hypothetical protein